MCIASTLQAKSCVSIQSWRNYTQTDEMQVEKHYMCLSFTLWTCNLLKCPVFPTQMWADCAFISNSFEWVVCYIQTAKYECGISNIKRNTCKWALHHRIDEHSNHRGYGRLDDMWYNVLIKIYTICILCCWHGVNIFSCITWNCTTASWAVLFSCYFSLDVSGGSLNDSVLSSMYTYMENS